MKKLYAEITLPDVVADLAITEAQVLGISFDEYFSNMIRTIVQANYCIKPASELIEND